MKPVDVGFHKSLQGRSHHIQAHHFFPLEVRKLSDEQKTGLEGKETPLSPSRKEAWLCSIASYKKWETEPPLHLFAVKSSETAGFLDNPSHPSGHPHMSRLDHQLGEGSCGVGDADMQTCWH